MNGKAALEFEKSWLEELKGQYQPDTEEANSAIQYLVARFEQVISDNVRLMQENERLKAELEARNEAA